MSGTKLGAKGVSAPHHFHEPLWQRALQEGEFSRQTPQNMSSSSWGDREQGRGSSGILQWGWHQPGPCHCQGMGKGTKMNPRSSSALGVLLSRGASGCVLKIFGITVKLTRDAGIGVQFLAYPSF